MVTTHWKNGTSGDWTGAGFWDTGLVPGALDNAVIDAAGAYTVAITTADAAASLTLSDSGATVVDTGVLSLTGALALTAGTFDLAAGGIVSGGTLSATGGSFAWNGGTLSGVTYQGVLDLTAAGASLSIANGLTEQGVGGSGTGTINADGGATSLNVLGTQTIDNMTINAGNLAGAGGTALNFGDLTLGAHATLNQVGGGAVSTSWATDTGTSLTNNGTIQASLANAGANIVVTSLVNNGLISAVPGAALSLQATSLTNNGTVSGVVAISAGTLTNNGVMTEGAGVSPTSFVNSGVFNDVGGFATSPGGWLNNGVFNLGNPTGIQSYLALVGGTGAPVAGASLGTLNLVGIGTQLRLLGSQSWQSGTVNVGGTAQQITESALTPVVGATSQLILGAQTVMNHTAGASTFNTGQLTLNGVINASAAGGSFTLVSGSLVDNGAINVSGGDHVIVNDPVTGTGSVTLASGGIAEFASSVASTDTTLFTDTSNATLRLGLGYAASFKSPIQGFTNGNTIDLAGIAATSATWSNGVLTVTGSGVGVTGPITLAMPGNYAGATFHVANDGILASYFGLAIYPGTNITVTGAPTSTPPVARIYGGAGATMSAAEGSVVAGPVASFTDSNTADTASQLSATIAWGDGTASAGVVTGGNGVFSVAPAAGHSFADEGRYATSIAITNGADAVTTILTGGVTATEADVLTPGAAPSIATAAGAAFNGIVATFSDSNAANSASDLSATINWGDGTSSTGVVTDVNGAISVAGSHTYSAAGNDGIAVTLNDTHGTATATATGTATVASSFKGTGATVAAAEGSAVTTAVASFTDANTAEAASAFTATIAWGDGTTSAGVVTGSNGAFAVAPAIGHAYAAEGTYVVGTTVVHAADGATLAITGSASSTEADGFAVGTAPVIAATGGIAYTGTVATFTDSYAANTASDLSATIAWGDGTTSTGTVSDTNGAISVSGSHTYAKAGSDAVSVTLTDTDGTATATTTGTATVATPYTGSGATVATIEGTAVTTAVASFTDAVATDTAGAFTATIAWGDGTTSAGVVSGSNGAFSVNAPTGHIYAAEGSYAVSTTVTHTADATTLALAGTVIATEADLFTGGAAAVIAATAGKAFSGTVATFADSYTANTASDLTATIVWGDGTTSTGTVTDASGAITVSGSHTYAAAGSDAVSVTLTDKDGTASATAVGTATVTAPAATPPGTYLLTSRQDNLVGGAGDNTFVAATNTLSNGDVIKGGTGVNTLQLSGGGTFNLAVVDTLSNIQIVAAQEGTGPTAQTVTLRENTAMTVNVASGPGGSGILINGAQNRDVINLGAGNDTIVMGVGETANGGGGNAIYKVDQDSIFDTINGGSTGTNTLMITVGGDQVMGSSISGMTAVQLTAKTNFTANTTANMAISGSAAGGDTIILGAGSQSVVAGGPSERVQASAANAGALVTGLGTGSTLEITSGGVVALNAATSVTTVKLDAATNLSLSGMSFLTATGSSGADTITAGATYQTLTGGGGADILAGYPGGFDTFRDTASGLNHDTIQGFLASDQIDVTNLGFASAVLQAVASGANTLVTLTSGATKTSFTMAGSFSTTGFHLASDGGTGTLLTHV